MLENQQIKYCNTCKTYKNVDMFYQQKTNKDKLSTQCKDCKKEYRLRNRDKLLQYSREYNPKYIKKNKESLAKRKKEYYQENKERIEIHKKQYYQDNKHIITEKRKLYEKENKDKIAHKKKLYNEKNIEHITQYHKQYNQTEKGIAVAKNARYKRRTITKQGDVTSHQILKLEQSAKICYWCHCSLKNVQVHIDHYVALSRGGEHTLSNLVVSCDVCNQKKHAKDPIVFANSIGKLL